MTRFERKISEDRRTRKKQIRDMGQHVQLRSERNKPGGYPALLGTRYVENTYLGSGTPSATTALFGDYSWKATATSADLSAHAALATGVHGHTVGTSFPGSPADGDTCYRTDLDTTFTYDGTRWLSEPFAVHINSVRGSAVSTFNPGVGVASDDANCPLFFGRTVRILAISSQLRGGTGSRVWTTRLRLDGAGSDSFACTNTITSSAGAWVRAAQEAVGLSLTATNRLNILTNATGGSETYAYSATLTCAWEAT